MIYLNCTQLQLLAYNLSGGLTPATLFQVRGHFTASNVKVFKNFFARSV